MATRIRGKSKQPLKSLKIEPETSRSESRALANWATTASVMNNWKKHQIYLVNDRGPIIELSSDKMIVARSFLWSEDIKINVKY